VKIYKPSIESLIVEATAGGQERPVVYIQTLQRHKNGQAGESGAIALTSVEVVVSGWNHEGRAIEWRGCAGSCPAVFEDEVRNLFERAEGVSRAVRQLLVRSIFQWYLEGESVFSIVDHTIAATALFTLERYCPMLSLAPGRRLHIGEAHVALPWSRIRHSQPGLSCSERQG